jgi:tetratricopeptide (TPR) repeat protein
MGKLGKNHDRVLLLQTAIKLNDANPSYYRNLGSAYYSLQSYELACEKYDKAIKIEPENLLNYHNKGSALLKLEKYE